MSSAIEGIPPFTFDDYVDGDEPYKYAYQYIGDKFTLERVLTVMAQRAQKVKVRNFRKMFNEYVAKQQAISKAFVLESVTQFDGQELELNCGGWKADEFGVSVDTEYGEKYACNHPILPVMRLVNIDTGVEKLMLAYRKGKQWRHTVADKKTLASNNSILELANVGVGVTSENSKLMVRYLHDVESLNYDQIPEKNSVSRLGWIEGSGFSPYVEELVFDGDANFRSFFESVKIKGNMEIWMDTAWSARKDGAVSTRILLAASFASTLVKPIGVLPFFVQVWGGTENGKSVGLMLAASVWANPEMGHYIHSFDSTTVGREKSAAFVNSLPLILDELQIIADKKQFDKDIYMLSEGVGRTRGNKSGGVDKTPTWANCIIISGEMPVTGPHSGGGAVNRVLEIECTEKLFKEDPRIVANKLKANYGFAGPIFVKMLQQEGAMEYAEAVYKSIYDSIKDDDTMEKQASAATLILTADRLATEWIFMDNQALTAEDIKTYLKSKEAVSVNRRGYEYLCEYVVQNKNRFCGVSDQTEVWGLLQNGMAYIVRNAFNRICEEANFNGRSLLSWLNQNDLIETKGKGFTITKRINGEPCHCVVLRLPQNEEDDLGILDDDLEI